MKEMIHEVIPNRGDAMIDRYGPVYRLFVNLFTDKRTSRHISDNKDICVVETFWSLQEAMSFLAEKKMKFSSWRKLQLKAVRS